MMGFSRYNQRRTGPFVMGLLALWLFIGPTAMAAVAAISESFSTTSQTITPGTILSLSSSAKATVEPSNGNSFNASLAGVAASKPILELSSSGKSSVQVAVSGTAQAFVSDINGAVRAGDKIAPSPIAGVGMKALSSGTILGSAQADLASVSTVTRHYTDKAGKDAAVHIGLLPVTVSISYYSAGAGSAISQFIPPFLQNAANVISGKQVSPLRVLIGLVVLLVGSVTVIVMLNTAVRSGIISLGRNPLAGSAVRRGLVDVLIAALGILAATFVIVYAVLTN